jgi:hypothetical protein
MRVEAKYVHAATTDKTEHTFAAIGIYPYRPNVISGEDLNHLRSLTKVRCLIRIWKGPKMGIQMVTLPFVFMVLIHLHLPLHDHLTV